MSDYRKYCHYEMKDKGREQYKKDQPKFADTEFLMATLMSDFDGKGYVSVYPQGYLEEEIVYSFAYLNSITV